MGADVDSLAQTWNFFPRASIQVARWQEPKAASD
jgi:hypothetical protein